MEKSKNKLSEFFSKRWWLGVTVFVMILLFAIEKCSNSTTMINNPDNIETPDIVTITPDQIPMNILDHFKQAGYMGCYENININHVDCGRPGKKICYKIEFQKNCDKNWAGVYWTNVADTIANWGQRPGWDFSEAGCTKITFWARGEKGNEIVEFRSGAVEGAQHRYRDSYKAHSTEGRWIKLSKDWKQYTIDLTGKDLSSVIGGFLWAANWEDNPEGLVFYLDDVWFE